MAPCLMDGPGRTALQGLGVLVLRNKPIGAEPMRRGSGRVRQSENSLASLPCAERGDMPPGSKERSAFSRLTRLRTDRHDGGSTFLPARETRGSHPRTAARSGYAGGLRAIDAHAPSGLGALRVRRSAI